MPTAIISTTVTVEVVMDFEETERPLPTTADGLADKLVDSGLLFLFILLWPFITAIVIVAIDCLCDYLVTLE